MLNGTEYSFSAALDFCCVGIPRSMFCFMFDLIFFMNFPVRLAFFGKKDERKILETDFYEENEKHPDGNEYKTIVAFAKGLK